MRKLLLAFILCTGALGAQSVASSKPMVVVISMDAFGAEQLRDPALPAPTLKRLMHDGAYAHSMTPVNPTVTWPNHTAMVTGVNAAKHHVLANGLIQNQREANSTATKIWPDAPKDQLVAVPTVYDQLHKAGMTSAEVDWVAIYHAANIDWRFHEDPDADGPIEKEMVAHGDATQEQIAHFHHGQSQAWRDQLYTEAAARIIREHHPNLILLHLLVLDSIEHAYGYNTGAAADAIAFMDTCVQKIIDTVREAGDLDRTTFLIVSDHGQQNVHKLIHPVQMLKLANVLPTEAIALPEGGLAYFYEKHASPELTARLKAAIEGKPGVRAVVSPEEFAQYGFPKPGTTDQAPDLVAFAQDAYAFAGGDGNGNVITDTPQTVGQHGYPNTNPLMHEVFIAQGRGIKNVGEVPTFPNVDVAATIAKLLGVAMPDGADGKPLTQILK